MSGNAPELRGPITVLLVDDDESVRNLARIMLERAGYEVIEAATGVEALERLAAQPEDIDAVLLDIMMPGMDGREALPAMREIDPALPVVFFSGYSRTEVATLLDVEGPHTSFLPKPFSREELTSAIERALW